ncbi:glycosyltransferase [Jeotgalibacillus proteolyticus]|uniref:glycosyltransferase n=1 Tax=Jeotgalibacillus proteolyticus TaxID=2082395 RepID=UPI003CF76606
MKKVLMMNSAKAYLPQIDATIRYFDEKKSDFKFFDSAKIGSFSFSDFDALWTFPGIDRSAPDGMPLIHEYASLSTGIFPKGKNMIKRSLNQKPDLRIFLNDFVQNGMQFKDGVVSLQRDMGVDDLFFRYQDRVKQYDCVYIGAITKARGIDRFLRHFKQLKEKHSLLMIGTVPDEIYEEFKSDDHIIFTGSIPYKDVPKYASQAVYGINYMPDKYPYNLQTSTKLLEYLAMNLRIISTEYKWVNHFKEKHNLSFITVDASLRDLEKKLISPPPQSIQKEFLESLSWSNVIKKSGLEQRLNDLFSQHKNLSGK